jgi:rod shape-determining protein MreC
VAIGRRTRSTRGMVILLVVASLVTITVDYREGSGGPLSKLSDAVQSVIVPMQDAVSKVTHPIGAFFSALAHLGSNAARIKRDELRIQNLVRERAQYRTALVELQNLQDLLGVQKSFDFQTTGADVIASGVSNFEWTVTIDKGSSDGIRKDMPVLSAQGLVGKVVQVTALGSKVLLIVDPGSSVASRLSVSQETGLVQGQGRDDLKMSLVDQSTTVAMGEGVETSSYSGGLFPAGIPIGTVSDVASDPATGEKDISVRPFVDFSKLDVVLVVTSFHGG